MKSRTLSKNSNNEKIQTLDIPKRIEREVYTDVSRKKRRISFRTKTALFYSEDNGGTRSEQSIHGT